MNEKNIPDFTVKEIQEEMLYLLKKFHKLCMDNDLKYSVHAGTMIGMVREHGFIPWDDDADISFTRSEYERFKNLLGGQEADIIFHAEEDEHYYFSIYDNAFPQLWMIRKGRPAVWIDFFIYDYIHENRFVQKFKIAELALTLGFLKNKDNMKTTHQRGLYSGGKYILIYCMYLIGKAFPLKAKYLIADRIRKGLSGGKTLIHRSNDRYIGIAFTYPKSVMGQYQLMDFEDTQLMITRDYDAILIPSYGDYMKPVVDSTAESDVHTFARTMIPFKK